MPRAYCCLDVCRREPRARRRSPPIALSPHPRGCLMLDLVTSTIPISIKACHQSYAEPQRSLELEKICIYETV